MFNAFVCHSQLVPQASSGSALHWSSYSLVIQRSQVLLSQPQLFPAAVFTERLPDFIEASSRLTKRLRTAVQEIGFATGGKGGEHLGDKLGIPISEATVLCSLFLVPLPEIGKVRVVGVDDWSWRRGKRFGSLLVNLETHKIVDLLADREAESVQQWLAAHPEVDVVSRDRGAMYIDGATWGAPQATQVADRWHILANLGDAVEEFLIRPANASRRRVSYANGSCISECKNCMRLE